MLIAVMATLALASGGSTAIAAEYRPLEVGSQWVSDVSETDATLHAEIDPNGLAANYELQINTVPSLVFASPTGCQIGAPGTVCTQAEVSGDPLAPGLVQPPEFRLEPADGMQHVSVRISEIGATLLPRTTYYYRVLAGSGVRELGMGGEIYGPVQSFVTPPYPTAVTEPQASTPAPAKPKPRPNRAGKKRGMGKGKGKKKPCKRRAARCGKKRG